MMKHLKEAESGFVTPEAWTIEIPYKHHGGPGHKIITENFANAILNAQLMNNKL
ncbi:MAG: hypothetical protein HGA23_09555 [Bacteroidales bacterium]|nr:hypothetical protein [Bacteroidales bacterium]